MDSHQQKDEPKREDSPANGAKAIPPAKKASILFGCKFILGLILFRNLFEGSSFLIFYPELYDFKTYSSQLMSDKDFVSDLLLTLLGFLQLPFVFVVFQALRRKNLEKYLTAKKLLCIPWILEFFKAIIGARQEINQQNNDEDWFTWLLLACYVTQVLLFAYFFLRDKQIRESFQDEKTESPNVNSERSENGSEEEETSVHLDKLNSCGYVIYKYWILISGLWTIQWFSLIITEGFRSQQDDPEKIDSVTEIIMGLTGLGVFALLVWHILNCFLLFEAVRRKNLKKVESSIKYMETYSIAVIVIIFFGMGSETMRNSLKKQGPEMADLGSMAWTLIVIATLLVWRIYYHFVYMYGVYKVRDALKAHEKLKHSQ